MNKQEVHSELSNLFISSSVDMWLNQFPEDHVFDSNRYLGDFIDFINSLDLDDEVIDKLAGESNGN